jgi:hypothetical protein
MDQGTATPFPQPVNGSRELQEVVAAWAATAEMHLLKPGALEDEIGEAESKLGCKLPRDLRALYAMSDGLDLLNGQFVVVPLFRDEEDPYCHSLLDYADFLRQSDWHVPQDLLMFGFGGTGEPHGVWLPRDRAATCGVVEIGAIFESRCMALQATTVGRFLKALTVYTLIAAEEFEALAPLRVPGRLLEREADERLYAEVLRWADPDQKRPQADPYVHPVDEASLRHLLG